MASKTTRLWKIEWTHRDGTPTTSTYRAASEDEALATWAADRRTEIGNLVASRPARRTG
jgi:hypothetical protein